ncbi:ABC transporter permease [Tsukamurella sp. 8F]|uniref:ABC transporter permease n=1 Tax=unclassified Tsukamurella TaxID=2633480 RepID=UPI0023B8A8D3|nr:MULTISPECIES: ABC transporter permease [unclassified Tsukamurella]MDF0530755.1 ABC transporter permease [Tsukamurella sp. 8J]MDF0587956.1 ABC transporter permease [Tsukamurella sp. 8F]
MTTLTPQNTVERRSAPIPLSRLVRVELRKLVDTRAGFWLVASMGVISLVVAVVMLIARRNSPEKLDLSGFVTVMNMPTSVILPILAIMLVTAEWSQRTALATFTMEPRRERVVLAKLGASLIAAIGAVVFALVIGALANVLAGVVYGAPAGAWNFSGADLVNSLTIQVFGLLVGFGFAALILNTPGAVVAYFALPSAMGIVAGVVPWFRDHLGRWIDTTSTNQPFQTGDWASGIEWARLAVSAMIWIGIPLALGIIRILRSEIK